MEVLHPRCAGLDIHKDSVVACARIAEGARVVRHVETFATTTADLERLSAWLKSHGVTHVVMEAAGVYCLGSRGRRNTLTEGVAMRAGKRRLDRALRAVLPRSPGRPGVAQRENRRRFWAAIAVGRSSEAAAIEVGVSPAVGARWFREAGGMSPRIFAPSAKPPSERYLSFAEREELALLRARGCGVRETARRLGRAASTISRELRRNAATRSGGLEYRATTAQWHAERAARRPKPAKLAVNAALRGDVQEGLGGGGGRRGRGGGRGGGAGAGLGRAGRPPPGRAAGAGFARPAGGPGRGARSRS